MYILLVPHHRCQWIITDSSSAEAWRDGSQWQMSTSSIKYQWLMSLDIRTSALQMIPTLTMVNSQLPTEPPRFYKTVFGKNCLQMHLFISVLLLNKVKIYLFDCVSLFPSHFLAGRALTMQRRTGQWSRHTTSIGATGQGIYVVICRQ